ncbi:MAG: sulfite exporter TauE/SafE family protein [Acidimicrobiales bacterium]
MTHPLYVLALAARASGAHHPSGWLLMAAGLLGGFAVGISGMGGGALMTPMLVLLFKVDAKVAIASDLVNSLVMKPIGGGVHGRRGTIHWGLVGRLVAGSVPAAFLGAFTLSRLGGGRHVQSEVKAVLGWALIVACASLLAKMALAARYPRASRGGATEVEPYVVKTLPTVLVGIAGGFVVGLTSVGSGSLMIVLLMLLYPRLSSRSLVGTDLVQAVPLVASAALGQLLFGHIDFGLAGALIAGSVPGVYIGARVSSRAPDGIVRPVLVFLLTASALALLFGNNNHGLAWALGVVVMTGVPLWGAVDAALRPASAWEGAGRRRSTWIVLLGVGAPFGIGLLAAVGYFTRVRRSLIAAAVEQPGLPDLAEGRQNETSVGAGASQLP